MNEKDEEGWTPGVKEGRMGLLIDWNPLLITNVDDRIEYMEREACSGMRADSLHEKGEEKIHLIHIPSISPDTIHHKSSLPLTLFLNWTSSI